MDAEYWTIKEILAALAFGFGAVWVVVKFIKYMNYLYGIPEFESDEDDDINNIGV